MYENIGARIPKEIRKQIEYVAKEEQTDKSQIVRTLLTEAIKRKMITLAMEKYHKKQISIGRAAELAHVHLADFMMLLAEQKVHFNYTSEDLKEDITAAIKAEKR